MLKSEVNHQKRLVSWEGKRSIIKEKKKRKDKAFHGTNDGSKTNVLENRLHSHNLQHILMYKMGEKKSKTNLNYICNSKYC